MSHDTVPSPHSAPGASSRFEGSPAAPAPQKTEGFAIAALVLGLLGGTVFALVLGFTALKRVKENGTKGRGLAVAGMVAGMIWAPILLSIYLSRMSGV